jgi:serine/threonine protein kinase
MINDFRLEEKIGEGGFATIYRSFHKPTNSMVAIKVIDIDDCCSRPGGTEMLAEELKALKLVTVIAHPFIVKFFSAFQTSSHCYLTFELFEAGDLRGHLKGECRFTEKMVAYLAGCIGSALHHVHSCGVLHRDIKPENIIFDRRGVPKLIDFGIAFVCPDLTNQSTMICTNNSGTRLYSAPEMFTLSHAHGPAADFWSLGVVVFEMLFSAPPFRSHCPRHFMKFAQVYSDHSKRSQTKEHDFLLQSIQMSNTLSCESPQATLAHRHTTMFSSLLKTSFMQQKHIEQEDIDQVMHAEFLPSYLSIKLPLIEASGKPISIGCYQFLTELLDLRHDRRLGGTEVKYSDFVSHPWLQENEIHIPNLVRQGFISITDHGYSPSPIILNLDAFICATKHNPCLYPNRKFKPNHELKLWPGFNLKKRHKVLPHDRRQEILNL